MYGWIQIDTNLSRTQITIIDWAYEDTCQPILAGQTQSSASIPTMTQWGMITFVLLLGGLAARMLRRERKEEN